MDPFPVRIDESQFVGDLKDRITEKRPDVDVVAVKLELYRIDVDASDLQKAIKDVETLAPRLIPTDRLNPTLDLKDVFPEGVRRKRIHILVRVPECESFSSRPGSILGVMRKGTVPSAKQNLILVQNSFWSP